MSTMDLSRSANLVFGAADEPLKELRALSDRARRQTLRIAAGVLAGLVMAAGLARWSSGHEVPARAPETLAPKSVWSEVVSPLRFYALDSAEFGREPRVYRTRRNDIGGGRQDILSFGPSIPGAVPSLRVAIYRFGTEPRADDRFFVEIARQAGQAGLSVVRSAQPGDLPTRLGVFQAADITVSGAGVEAACLGFEFSAPNPGLQISGYACGSPARPMDRRTLACALDRLDLLGAAGDPDLARFFGAAEQARGEGCGGLRGGIAGRPEPGAGKPVLRQSDAGRKLTAKPGAGLGVGRKPAM